MEGLGFTTERFGAGNDDVYHKEAILNFEMRTALFGPLHDKGFYERYRDVKCRLLGDGREKRYAPEDFYLYLVAHERKHYDLSGTGRRSLLDVYVYLKAEELNMRYVGAEAEKLGIGDFEERNRSLAMRLFGDAALADADEEMLSYMVDSGTFGTMEHNVDNQIARHARVGYLAHSAFPPFQAMEALYPVLGKAPALLSNELTNRVVKTAERYLKVRGMEIVDTAWSKDCLADGIDIVAQDGFVTVFANASVATTSADPGFHGEPI